MGPEALPALAPEKKRSQSKPLRLSPFDSARCMGFLEIEAIEAIWLVVRELRRNMGRFSRSKDRHAPGFRSSQLDAGAQGLTSLPSHAPGFVRENRPARRPCPGTILECPLYSAGRRSRLLPRTRIRTEADRATGGGLGELLGSRLRQGLRALTTAARAKGCPRSFRRGSLEPYGGLQTVRYRKMKPECHLD
jgi:hypothetical protein